MAWGCKWESKIDFYYNLQSRGMLQPEDVKPNVEPFEFYVDAFRELSTCRPSGMGGLSAIPFVSIVEYAKIYDVGDFHEFLYLVRIMDSEVLKIENSKAASKPTGNSSNGTTNTSSRNKGRNRHKG